MAYCDGCAALGKNFDSVRARLVEAESTIGALKHMIGEQTDEIATLRASIEERERAIVWAVRGCATVVGNTLDWFDGDSVTHERYWDSTDADLIRVVIAASKGE